MKKLVLLTVLSTFFQSVAFAELKKLASCVIEGNRAVSYTLYNRPLVKNRPVEGVFLSVKGDKSVVYTGGKVTLIEDNLTEKVTKLKATFQEQVDVSNVLSGKTTRKTQYQFDLSLSTNQSLSDRGTGKLIISETETKPLTLTLNCLDKLSVNL